MSISVLASLYGHPVSSLFGVSLAIAKEGELTIGTIDDIQKLHIRSIPLGEHARYICHQEHSRTFAICSLKNQSPAEESEMHFIRLLDDQTFEFISTYPLDTFEYGCSILRCSFSDDSNVYYCVGTAYVLPKENEATNGRILVFIMKDGKLQLIMKKETKGAVYSLNAFNGKLLAAINQKIQLYSGKFLTMTYTLVLKTTLTSSQLGRIVKVVWLTGGMDGGNGSLIGIFILE
ncbi:hypothetical protein Patl1_10206 [Pistacia atlantica]|uniref:Uncharacterized protein n=1 Tax=Pistacia atlantica TaxID=434234 RepID=A0ACC1A435_9ROSI|nr:hypothetical protein Patl1_10206 [Pistacia atlantica]